MAVPAAAWGVPAAVRAGLPVARVVLREEPVAVQVVELAAEADR
ncbi:hypothetical protein [Pseudomonas mangiferae]|nr:hypothetical protein [Pseudomonas mangiferae]